MVAMWYVIVSFMLVVYVVLDGRNFGAGMLHCHSRQDRARSGGKSIAAIGPLWSWHKKCGLSVLAAATSCLRSFRGSWLRRLPATTSRCF